MSLPKEAIEALERLDTGSWGDRERSEFEVVACYCRAMAEELESSRAQRRGLANRLEQSLRGLEIHQRGSRTLQEALRQFSSRTGWTPAGEGDASKAGEQLANAVTLTDLDVRAALLVALHPEFIESRSDLREAGHRALGRLFSDHSHGAASAVESALRDSLEAPRDESGEDTDEDPVVH